MLKPSFASDPCANLPAFQQCLVAWFQSEGKSYPWRETRDPYAILISEIMLQQTRIGTVLKRGFYRKFLTTFPTPHELAASNDDLLLRTWEGLGYYRRARLLRDTARALLAHREFPQDFATLLALPGIGTYTANALRAFAFDLPAAVVDGNIARVVTRIFDCSVEIDSQAGKNWLEKIATTLAENAPQRLYHSALMELGQTHCKPGQPDCWSCPISSFCLSKNPEFLPRKKAKAAPTDVITHVIFARKNESILLAQEQGTRRIGFWKLPEREPLTDSSPPAIIHECRYTITRYRVTMRVSRATPSLETHAHEKWISLDDLATVPISAPYRRAIEHLLREEM